MGRTRRASVGRKQTPARPQRPARGRERDAVRPLFRTSDTRVHVRHADFPKKRCGKSGGQGTEPPQRGRERGGDFLNSDPTPLIRNRT